MKTKTLIIVGGVAAAGLLYLALRRQNEPQNGAVVGVGVGNGQPETGGGLGGVLTGATGLVSSITNLWAVTHPKNEAPPAEATDDISGGALAAVGIAGATTSTLKRGSWATNPRPYSLPGAKVFAQAYLPNETFFSERRLAGLSR